MASSRINIYLQIDENSSVSILPKDVNINEKSP